METMNGVRDRKALPALYVLRHGETEWNTVGRFQGGADSPLTLRGEEQALQQGYLLSTIKHLPDSVYTSPQGRAVRTAELALAFALDKSGKTSLAVQDERLREVAFGEWEGKTRTEVKAQSGDWYANGHGYFQSPGGENFESISGRVIEFLNELHAPAVVVTHGVTSIVLRGLYLGLSVDQLLQLPHDQGCIYHLSGGQEVCLTVGDYG